jgi:hypothetical protein
LAGLLPTYALIDTAGIVVLIFISVSLVVRARTGKLDLPHPRKELLGKFASVLALDVGTSRPLWTCNRAKWASHLFIFWGFVFLMVATVLAYFFKPEGAVLPLTSSVNMFGNSGGAMVIGGFVVMFSVRFKESGSVWHINRSDLFLIFLFLATFTGFSTETSIYTLGRGAFTTAVIYWTHMVFVAVLLGTAPYTKFVHAVYKPSWLLQVRLEEKPKKGGVHKQPPVQEVES